MNLAQQRRNLKEPRMHKDAHGWGKARRELRELSQMEWRETKETKVMERPVLS